MHLTISRAGPSDFNQLIPLAFRAFADDAMLPVFFGHDSPSSHAHVKREWLKGTREANDIWFKVEDMDEVVDVEEIDVDLHADDNDNAAAKDGGDAGGDVNPPIHDNPSARTATEKHPKTTQKQTKIIGASNWRINATYIPPSKDEPAGPSLHELSYLLDAQERLDAQHILTDHRSHRRSTQEPHVFLSLLFVHPAYQRQGLGRVLMQWGNEVADTMMLPCYLESSSKGEGLYTKMGYQGVYRAKWETASFPGAGVLRMRREKGVGRWEIRGGEVERVC